LYRITVPAIREAELLDPPAGQTQWPVMMFSHGVGGTRYMYSQLVGNISSHGVIVIAPDHRDGTGPFSHIRRIPRDLAKSTDAADKASRDQLEKVEDQLHETTSNDTPSDASYIGYQVIPHTMTQETFDARYDQLRIRVWELNLVYEALLRINSGAKITNLKFLSDDSQSSSNTTSLGKGLSMFHNKLAVTKAGSIIWAGHSFGAATVVQFVKSAFYQTELDQMSQTHSNELKNYLPLITFGPKAEIRSQVTTNSIMSLYDIWCFPLLDLRTRWLWNRPLPVYTTDASPGGRALLNVLSQNFQEWDDNRQLTKKLLSAHPGDSTVTDWNSGEFDRPSIYYIHQSSHISQSDFGLLFPHFVSSFLKAKEPRRLLNLNVRATLQLLRQNGVVVAPIQEVLHDFPDHSKHSFKSSSLNPLSSSDPASSSTSSFSLGLFEHLPFKKKDQSKNLRKDITVLVNHSDSGLGSMGSSASASVHSLEGAGRPVPPPPAQASSSASQQTNEQSHSKELLPSQPATIPEHESESYKAGFAAGYKAGYNAGNSHLSLPIASASGLALPSGGHTSPNGSDSSRSLHKTSLANQARKQSLLAEGLQQRSNDPDIFSDSASSAIRNWHPAILLDRDPDLAVDLEHNFQLASGEKFLPKK
jgi:hypothetical protein